MAYRHHLLMVETSLMLPASIRVAQQGHIPVCALHALRATAHSTSKPLPLYLACPLNPRADVGAWFPQAIARQLAVRPAPTGS